MSDVSQTVNTNRRRRGARAAMCGVLSLACAVAVPGATEAGGRPRWEIGTGIGAASFPEYRGSDQRRNIVLPFPYLVYRGDFVNVDHEGVRGKVFESNRARLDLSLGASLPVRSDRIRARAGMPDLDPSIEFGPSLKIVLGADRGDEHVWSLGLPLRAVVATDLRRYEAIGWTFSPRLEYTARGIAASQWDVNVSLGLTFATEAYHDYYYEVAPAFATPARPAFDAAGGYGGAGIGIVLSKRFRDFWAGAFARYDDLHGAAFADSPLVRREASLSVGAGIAWVVAVSGDRVE